MVEPRRSEKACGLGVSRRDFLRAGGLGLASYGVGLPAIPTRASTRPESERSVILLLLVGGPSQLETFDPKPDAPAGIRGPFDSIATRVPGIRVSEHLPRLAARMDRVALLRSVHHDAAPIHETGHQLLQTGRLGRSGEEFPHFGSVVARIDGCGWQRPASVVLPGPITSTGVDIPHGQSAGCLGPGFEPEFLTLDRAAGGLADEPDRIRDAYGPTAFGRSLPPGQASGRIRRACGHGQHVRDGLRPGFLGLPRGVAVQHVRRLRPRGAADVRPGLLRDAGRPRAVGTARFDAGRRRGRIRPDAPDQRIGRPRPLAGGLDRRDGRRRYPGRPGRRRERPPRRRTRRPAGDSPRPPRDDLSRAWASTTNPMRPPRMAGRCRWSRPANRSVNSSLDPQPVLVQPGQRPLHQPAGLPQAAAVVGPLLGQHRLDPHQPQPLPVRLRVVRPVALQGVGPAPRPARLAGDRGQRVDQRGHLAHVVAVGRRHRARPAGCRGRR